MKRHAYLVALLIALLTSFAIGPAHADGSRIYVVRPGDTMTGITARNGITATQLATANGMRWNDWVYVGQRLKIPVSGTGIAPNVQPVASGVYVVRAGDTLVGIAARHGGAAVSALERTGLDDLLARADAILWEEGEETLEDGRRRPLASTPPNSI